MLLSDDSYLVLDQALLHPQQASSFILNINFFVLKYDSERLGPHSGALVLDGTVTLKV